jgi:DNA-binding PadR family transcriptional regulator
MAAKKSPGFGTYPLRYLALGLLMLGPDHGYQLDQKLDEDFGMIWKAGQTKLYVTLSSLEKKGLLRSEMEPQENRPDRKIYHLTEEGRETFLKWVREPVPSLRAVRVELLAKLRFFDLLDLAGLDDLISSQQTVFQEMIQEWSRDKAQEKDLFMSKVYDFRIQQAEFILNWLKNYQKQS